MTSHPTIEVRHLDIEFSDSMGPRWAGDNPLSSALLGSLSVAFPPGERFFIESVRHYLPRLEDAALRKAVFAFIGQEANHNKEHRAFNEHLDRAGYPALAMQEWVARRIARIQAASSPEANLARTTALEHFTAIMASAILEHPELLEGMSPPAAKLWAWHAIEEIEHRSVAFDVYQRAVGDEALRVRTMFLVTLFFTTLVSLRTVWMMRATGALSDLGPIGEGLNVLWGRPGIFRKIIPRYLDYYHPDFHPSQHDYDRCVATAKARYLDEPA
jgi:hypothetical protein